MPGCRAVSGLHVHHIVFRSRGGGDEPENLVTACDWHHRAIHEGWVRCAGRAPSRLYWELGVADRAPGKHGATERSGIRYRRNGASEAPIARFFGHRRLENGEYWDGVAVQTVPADGPTAPEKRAAV